MSLGTMRQLDPTAAGEQVLDCKCQVCDRCASQAYPLSWDVT